MNPLRVVEMEVSLQASAGFSDRQILMKINLLVFHRSPETLHKDVVINPAPAIHTNADVFSGEDFREIDAGKLNALIGIENLGPGNLQRPLYRPGAKIGVQGGSNIPGQNIAAVPVHNGPRYTNP